MKFKFKGYEESNFWLALSPLSRTNMGKGIRGLFLEVARYRVEFTWADKESEK